jgi:hypothetical protein
MNVLQTQVANAVNRVLGERLITGVRSVGPLVPEKTMVVQKPNRRGRMRPHRVKKSSQTPSESIPKGGRNRFLNTQ